MEYCSFPRCRQTEHGSLHKYRRVDFLIKVESRNATYGASEGTGVERSIQTGTIPPIPI